jgi:hypothetical protein
LGPSTARELCRVGAALLGALAWAADSQASTGPHSDPISDGHLGAARLHSVAGMIRDWRTAECASDAMLGRSGIDAHAPTSTHTACLGACGGWLAMMMMMIAYNAFIPTQPDISHSQLAAGVRF